VAPWTINFIWAINYRSGVAILNSERVRYFIVSSGRCGSSLLASILADSGAEFGLSIPSDWSQDSGEMEHPDIAYTSRQFRRANYILPFKRSSLIAKYLIDIRRSLGKKRAKQVLEKVRYAKADNLDYWIWNVPKLGYHPRIIASYRDFASTARSFFILRGMGFTEFSDYYYRVYGNSLLMLNTYGGCAVSFEELIDENETAWADALSQTTSLPADSLLHSRNERLKQGTGGSVHNPVDANLISPKVRRIEENMRELKGRFIPPSRQILRKWGE
jgi:hypothetical protein